jgi:thiamine kinase-like enzyme
MAKRHRIVFSHNDLSPRNVLVDSWGRLVGILDWEMAGWFLEYWEYTAALGSSVSQPWIEMLKGVFGEYEPERVQAESVLSTNVTHV